MRTDTPGYTLVFATAVCVVCSLFVATATVLLKDRQQVAKTQYIQKSVLLEVAGLVDVGGSGSADRDALFDTRIRARLVDLASGEYVDDPSIDPLAYNQRAARNDPARSREAPANDASVSRVPQRAVVYQRLDEGKPVQVVLPFEGNGLYGTMYGFLALDADATTIRGIAFYEQTETPGLGGEVTNPGWRSLWPGRKALDDKGQPRIALVKGSAGPPATDPYHVDGLSGATVTSNAVTNMLAFWLGEQGFGPYLARARAKGL